MKTTLAYALMTVGILGVIGAGAATYAAGGPGFHFLGGGDRTAHLEEKAEALGLDADQLKADLEAGQSFREAAEAQGVTSDELAAHREEQREEHLAVRAEELGLDLDQLKSDIDSGLSFLEAAAAQGVTAEDLRAHHLEKLQERLDALVVDGDLTQEEADERFEKISDRIENSEPGEYHRGGRRGHRGSGFGFKP